MAAQKASTMPAITSVVEAEIVPRLVAAHQARRLAQAAASDAKHVLPDAAFIAGVAARLIANDEAAVKADLETLREKGMTAEAVCLRVLTPVARHLGDQWEADQCSFLEVTTATASLHGIMNELRPAFRNREVIGAFRRRMMLFAAPGEQHRFGLSMLAEFFRKDGWQVALPIGTTIKQITTLVSFRPIDIVGFSAGTDRHLDALSTCIAAVRANSCNPDVAVMVGGPVFLERPELAQAVGADATAACAEEAVLQAGRLVEARRTANRSPTRRAPGRMRRIRQKPDRCLRPGCVSRTIA